MSTYTPLSIKKALCQKYLAGDCDLGDRCKGAHPASTTAGNSATSMPDLSRMTASPRLTRGPSGYSAPGASYHNRGTGAPRHAPTTQRPSARSMSSARPVVDNPAPQATIDSRGITARIPALGPTSMSSMPALPNMASILSRGSTMRTGNDPGEMDVDYAQSITGLQAALPPRPVLEPQSTNEAQIATEAQPIDEAEIESDDGSDNESIPDTGIPWDAMTGAPVDMTKFDAADEDF